MSWTSPRTWVAEELVTATMMNTHVRDNLNALHDFIAGAQDFGANWQISTGRELRFQDPDVAHGMTSQLPTDVYARQFALSGTAGGFSIWGFSDTNAVALELFGAIGTTTPSVAVIAINAAKKNGTTTQALAATEVAVDVMNNGTTTGVKVFGDGNLQVGDTGFRLEHDLGGADVPGIQFDTGDEYRYGRGTNAHLFRIGATNIARIVAGGIEVTTGCIQVGFSGTMADDEVHVGDADFKLDWVSSTATRLQFDANDLLNYSRSANQLSVQIGSGNNVCTFEAAGVALGGTAGDYGGGDEVIYVHNAATNPSSNPAAGGILYADAGAGKWRGSGGTTTTFGPAEPHCPTCGRDFVLEWESARYGHLIVCLWCATDGLKRGVVVKREAAAKEAAH